VIEDLKARVGAEKRARDYAGALRAIAEVKPAVDEFFDKVLVMAEDEAVRRNRLALLREVSSLFADLADFRKLQAELPQQPHA
jgi:glycyl-tRNA synthetase beta chain